MPARQTGGDRRHLSFGHDEVETIPALRDKLTHYDEYFFEEPDRHTTLAIVLDRILADLPEDQAEPVRLVHLEGRSLREAGAILGIDHKTVKARMEKGVTALRRRLLDSMWVASMLRGYIPKDEILEPEGLDAADISTILKTLRSGDE